MQIPLASSDWSTPPIDSEVTKGHHLGDLARWLQSAGAEARLALALCSGARARATIYALLTKAGINIVPAPVTSERPIHADLMAHQGSHFNSTLFVMGGFEQTDAADVFRILDGQRNQLSRTATWVLLMLESTATLEALYAPAPNLADTIMRRCLVIDAEVVDAVGARVSPAISDGWRRSGRIAELVFDDVMNPGTGTDYFTFSRLVRTGYVSQLAAVTSALHPERRELVNIWKTRERPSGGPLTPAVAEALVRHTVATGPQRDEATAALADLPAVRAAIGLDVSEVPFWGAFAAVRRAADAGEASTPDTWARLRADAASLTLSVRVMVEETVSRAAAASGDFEACVDALERAVEWADAVSPELRFSLLEKMAQLYAFMEKPGPANAVLTAMEREVPGLESPYYEGRSCFALARFFVQKDPTVSQRFLRRAATLFGVHGHRDWAEEARAELEPEG